MLLKCSRLPSVKLLEFPDPPTPPGSESEADRRPALWIALDEVQDPVRLSSQGPSAHSLR